MFVSFARIKQWGAVHKVCQAEIAIFRITPRVTRARKPSSPILWRNSKTQKLNKSPLSGMDNEVKACDGISAVLTVEADLEELFGFGKFAQNQSRVHFLCWDFALHLLISSNTKILVTFESIPNSWYFDVTILMWLWSIRLFVFRKQLYVQDVLNSFILKYWREQLLKLHFHKHM